MFTTGNTTTTITTTTTTITTTAATTTISIIIIANTPNTRIIFRHEDQLLEKYCHRSAGACSSEINRYAGVGFIILRVVPSPELPTALSSSSGIGSGEETEASATTYKRRLQWTSSGLVATRQWLCRGFALPENSSASAILHDSNVPA
ncbi:hypothetical protein F4777DRAFT_580888 [Nemania sp. FL0916]|nr:hypothetical protein F4777DRAFT_580888 [Nemania sp. FL0916]